MGLFLLFCFGLFLFLFVCNFSLLNPFWSFFSGFVFSVLFWFVFFWMICLVFVVLFVVLVSLGCFVVGDVLVLLLLKGLFGDYGFLVFLSKSKIPIEIY